MFLIEFNLRFQVSAKTDLDRLMMCSTVIEPSRRIANKIITIEGGNGAIDHYRNGNIF